MANVIGALGVAADEKERADAMEKLAFIDSLTGLPNQRAFDEAFSRFQANAQRELAGGNPGEAAKASLVAMDLDKFKEINDRDGHAAGDRMLQDVAAVVSGRIRPTDVAARLHGDEFAILLVGATPEEAQIVTEDIRELIELIGRGTISAGITEVDPNKTAEENLHEADGALYGAKDSRNQVVLRNE
jgi:diguanylate cyclase (GGDEF)-like protein